MKSRTDVVTGIFLLIFCAVGAWSVSQIPPPEVPGTISAASFPKAVLILLTVLSFILLIKGFFYTARTKWPEAPLLKKMFLMIGLFLAYLGGIAYLGDFFANMENPPFHCGMGFSVSTFIFLLLALPLLGRRRPLEIFLVAAITTAVIIAAFVGFFQVQLP